MRSRLTWLGLPLALALGGCGGGSTATFNLMDAPPPGVTSVKVAIASIAAHVDETGKTDKSDPLDKSIDNDGKWHTLAVDRTVDLVAHQGETAADILGTLDLPAGKVTQIRLVVDTAKPNTATVNGKDCALDTAKVEKTGIKIDHVFKAFDSKAGGKIEAWVDFDLEKSLKSAGTCYSLEPQLHLTKVKVDGAETAL